MATEKRLIDANALMEKMENTSSDVCADYGDGFCQHGYSTQLFRLMVSESPTVDAVEVVHAKAVPIYSNINHEDTLIRMDSQCPLCGALMLKVDNCCPNCGAKMDGGNEDG